MTPRRIRRLAALILLAALALVVAACGSSSSSSSGSSSGSSSSGSSSGSGSSRLIKKNAANAGKKITVGSKNFTEQFILGEIYAQALQAAGFTVKKELNLGSEQIAYKAVKSGQIDGYPEYTGTALTSFFNVPINKVPRDPAKAYQQAKADYAKNKITALPATPFQDTYALTSTVATAQKYGNPATFSQLMAKTNHGKNLKISGFPECRQRLDCLLGIKKFYGYAGGFVSSQGKYDDLDSKQADLTFGFSTDGQLSLTKKYHAYADDKQIFPPYNVTFSIRNDALKRIGPKGQAVIEKVQSEMTVPVMRELNSRVDLDKQTPKAVAHEYLKEGGYIQ